MTEGTRPKWFEMMDGITSKTMQRIAKSTQDLELPLQVKYAPMQAHWFILDSLLLANTANREGMHSNALVLTRQSIEAISIVELEISKHPDAQKTLLRSGIAIRPAPANFANGLVSTNGLPTVVGSGRSRGPTSWRASPARFRRMLTILRPLLNGKAI